MGNWDKLTPLDSALVSTGDDIIRETKVALGEALDHENSTFPGASPTTAPIFIPGLKRGNTAGRPTGDSLVSGRFYANTTLNVIERYNGSTWDTISTNLPATVKAIFYQASAPVGWTAVAVDDKFLRVVTSGGTGGTTGGSIAASTGLAHTHTLASHTHTISTDGAHIHTIPPDNVKGGGTTGNTVSTSDGGHDHGGASGSSSEVTDSQLGVFAFADMVIATKD